MSDTFYPLEQFGNKTQQAVMPIIAIADGEVIPLGTGFAIAADGLMMTAKHVIDEFCVPHPKRRDGRGTYSQAHLYALYISDQHQGDKNREYLGGPIPIVRVWASAELDIAYCATLTPEIDGKPLRFPIVKLSPGIPPVGEQILGFGYHKSAAKISEESEAATVVDYSHDTAFTRGSIQAVYSPKRDNHLLTFPCFQTDARFEPGMSGGPVFRQSGSVCGVICSSYSAIADQEGFVSFCSLLWLAMGTSVDVALSPGARAEAVLVYDLIKKGLIAADDTIKTINVEMHADRTRSVYVLVPS